MNYFPKKIMILGSGELGKEFTIAAKRLGCYVIACDKYEKAPAMQLADEYLVFDMANEDILLENIIKIHPDFVVPEIEALAVDTLLKVEQKGIKVIPNAKATAITMNRDRIRDLAANELNLNTARFAYANDKYELIDKAKCFKFPLIVKPIMSSSGKGQSLVKSTEQLQDSWENAIKYSRGKSQKVIIEEFINFDFEITLLTIKQRHGRTLFCEPIGHHQENGDYQSSWHPAEMVKKQLDEAQLMAKKITDSLDGEGIFGVEFFIKGKEVIFSELSPRPHDTGLVTMISQNLNEFELHLRAILGIPIPEIKRHSFSASRVILSKKKLSKVNFRGIEDALKEPNTEILLFGKPTARSGRRMGVALASDKNVEKAKAKAFRAANSIEVF